MGGKMKKILWAILIIFCLTGCNNLMNTPTKKVELLLSKYQKKDEEVLKQLGDTLLTDAILDIDQKKLYLLFPQKYL